MRTDLSDRYKVLFIIFVSLGIYYPSIFGEANSTDDSQMITALINTESVSWKGLFFPSSIYYYRPLLGSTFLFDRYFFNCTELFMHFHNVLIHTANGVIVFFVMREFLRRFRITGHPYVPMLASLLFILHPVNTESVNWISGRTDILAGLFIFLSFFVFLKKGIESLPWAWLAALLYLFGLLSKEVAIGMPAIIGLLFTVNEGPSGKLSLQRKFSLLAPFLCMTALYFLMRKLASGNSDAGISAAAQGMRDSDITISVRAAFKVFGFYVKKLFVPLPLNFAIVEINKTFYLWFGMLASGITGYLFLKKRNSLLFLFLFAIAFFIPAIPVAISKIAWTPLAERYLYVSSFGASALAALAASFTPLDRRFAYGIFSLVLIISAVITAHRNIIWQNNLTLYEDTVRKSPAYPPARNEYAVALAREGRIEESRKQLAMAEKYAAGAPKSRLFSLNRITAKGKTLQEAEIEYIALLEASANDKVEVTRRILEKILSTLEAEALEEKDQEKVKSLYTKEIGYISRLNRIDRSGFNFYRLGQLYLGIGDKGRAKENFAEAVELDPNAYFAEPARKVIKKIEHDAGN